MVKLCEKVVGKGFCKAIDAYKNNRKKWLVERQKGIGGSDAGAILQVDNYKTPLTCYLSKIEKIEVQEPNNACKWGNILEVPLVREVKKLCPKGTVVQHGNVTYINNKNTFMRANLDGLIDFSMPMTIRGRTIGGLCGLEIKTSATGAGFDDGIPDSYYCQVQHYMGVTGLDAFLLATFLLAKRELELYVVERNNDFINDMVKFEKTFWNDFVEKREPPAPIGKECEASALERLACSGEVTLDDSCYELVQNYQQLQQTIKDLESEKRLLSQTLEKEMITLASKTENTQKDGLLLAYCKDYKISFNTYTRSAIDTKALKDAGLYDKYSKEIQYKSLRIGAVK